jgi:glycolate oxidase iron-sulfur subunit
MLHIGRRDEAMVLARRTVDVLRPLKGDAIVTTAAGCGAMLQSYGELLGDTAAADIAARVRDITTVLAESYAPPPTGGIARRVTYHDACHLAHGQGVRAAPRTLLRNLPGVELVELSEADHCCGSAGTYNLTEPETARRLVERTITHILATGAGTVVTANPGCLLQIRAGLLCRGAPVEVVHPVDLLAELHFGSANCGCPRPSPS